MLHSKCIFGLLKFFRVVRRDVHVKSVYVSLHLVLCRLIVSPHQHTFLEIGQPN